MTNQAITVAAAKAKRHALEKSIFDLLNVYQRETGIEPQSVELQRVAMRTLADEPQTTFLASVVIHCRL